MNVLENIPYRIPSSLSEALQWMDSEETRGCLLAGTTDLMPQWQAGVPLPKQVIDLFNLPELNQLEETETDIILGACVTHADISNEPFVAKYIPALVMACASVGARQIQNRGTLGGSMANASPAGDVAPALLISDGQVVVGSVDGERMIPVQKFFLDYRKMDLRENEIILRFELPKVPENGKETFLKLGTRGAQAISKVMIASRAVVLKNTIEKIALAIGCVAPTCIRLPALEQWLEGKSLSEEVIAEAEQRAAKEVKPIDDIRSTADYRQWVSGRLVRGILDDLIAR